MTETETPLEGGDLLRFVYTCPLALLLTDSDGEIQLLNGAATSLLMPFAADGELDNLLQLIEAHDSDIRKFLQDNVTKLKSQQLVRRVAMTPEFVDRLFHLSFTFGRFDDGYSVTVEDVTEYVVQEQQNKELAAREAHERGRVEVASGILHDLGNALTGIATRAVDIRSRVGDTSTTNNLERLCGFLRPRADELDSVLGAGKGAALLTMLDAMLQGMNDSQQGINDSMEKMLAFIAHAQELLTINRTFAGMGSDPSKGKANLRKLTDDLRMMMSESVKQRGGQLDIDLEDNLPSIAIDRSRLMQVMINLIKNATEAYDTIAKGEGLVVTASISRNDDGGLKILVQDNGPGFAAELNDDEKLFDAGYSSKERGSGVGLSGCRRIIAAYGGEIHLESNGPGCGTAGHDLVTEGSFQRC